MNRVPAGVRFALLALTAASLSACITVFPKAKPAQLYRFGGHAPPAAAEAGAPAPRVGVAKVAGSFNAAASGDGILTVTGSEIAYIAESRWAEPAVTLFDEAVARAFSANTGPARLVVRGDPGRAAYTLRLDVQRFEADYDHGPKAAPDIRVEIHAVLIRVADRATVKDETLSLHARASANRVSAIVEAFDKAMGEATDKLVALANDNVAAPAAS